MYYNYAPRTVRQFAYNRDKAVEYAHSWALRRNSRYYDFEKLGGDCTNFASQVLYAGSGTMNYTKTLGWYYADSYNRTASWTGVDFLCNFLINNRSIGPQAEMVDVKDILPGDIIQLSFQGGDRFNHSLAVVKTGYPADVGNINICTHTYDRDNYPLSNYNWTNIRFLHIVGVGK